MQRISCLLWLSVLTLGVTLASRKTVVVHALYPTFADVESMDQASSLVIVGVPTMTFDASEHVGRVDDSYNGSFYTFRKIRVQKILKNDSSQTVSVGATIDVVEPATLLNYPNQTQVRLSIENYVPMNKGHTYIIFTRLGTPQKYVIVNHNFGKLPYDTAGVLSKTLMDTQFNSEQRTSYEKFLDDAKSKYGLK